MKRSKLARFIDNTTLSFSWFVLCYLFLKQFMKNIIICFVVSILLCLIFIKIIHKIQSRKYRKLGIKNSEQKQIENLIFFLKTKNLSEQNIFIKQLFSGKILQQKNQFFLLENNTAILNRISKKCVDENDVFYVLSNIKFLEKNDVKEVAIICSSADESAIKTTQNANDFSIFFITPDILFAIVKNNHYNLPETEKTQISYNSTRIAHMFCKNQAKNMLKASFVLCILSMIIPYSKHYIYVGFIAFAFSILLYIFGREPTKEKQTRLLEKANDDEKIYDEKSIKSSK